MLYIYILFDLVFIFTFINNDVDNGMNIQVGNTHLEFAIDNDKNSIS